MLLRILFAGFIIGIVAVVIFIKECKTALPLPEFLKEQIVQDLERININKEAIESTWKQVRELNQSFVRFTAEKKKLIVEANPHAQKSKRLPIVIQAFEKAVSKLIIKPPLDCIVCLEDSLDINPHPAPIFTFACKAGTEGVILMPDFEAIYKKERKHLYSHILRNNSKNPWGNKKELAFWRGTFTGAMRLPLVQLSERCPNLVDAHFVAYVPPYQTAELPLYPKMRPKEHLPYKYLVDIDGNSCCYSRTYWILLANCVMLKQQSPNVQWFYKGLKPFVHYVPFAEDVSDLTEKIGWCQSNDADCQKMAQQATDFAKRYLGYESNIHYLYHLLSAYREKQKA